MTDRQIEAGKKVIERRCKSGDILSEVANTLDEMLEAMREAGKERTDE